MQQTRDPLAVQPPNYLFLTQEHFSVLQFCKCLRNNFFLNSAVQASCDTEAF